MKTNNNIPAYRFQGYTDAWELRKLGEVATRVTRKNSDLLTELALTISAQYGLIDQTEFFDKRIASKDVSGYYLVKNGEFAYNKSTSSDAPWGAVKRLDRYDMGVLSTLYIVFGISNFERVCSDFLVTYFDTNLWHKEVQAVAAEGARNHGLLNISASDFLDIALYFPKSLPEQEAIGTFFSTLDRQITLHQRKLDTLKEQKKTYLKLLFPAKGQTTPALRFQGFEDDWQEVKLGDVVEKSGSGGTPKSTNKSYYGGNIPFLSITDITQSGKYITNTEKTLTELGLENSSAWIVPKGAISLAMYASVGKLAILKTDVATSQAFFNMVFSNEIVRDYVYFVLDKAQLFNEWLPLISTGTQGNLNA
ncbi:TPA: restriction endonuclease subunit S, partial [Streptococcus suis]